MINVRENQNLVLRCINQCVVQLLPIQTLNKARSPKQMQLHDPHGLLSSTF